MQYKDKVNIIHRDIRRIEIDTLSNRIIAEYFISNENNDGYGIILFGPDVRYCKSSMHFPLIDSLFTTARHSNISVIRIEFEATISDSTEQDILNQYITQASVSIDHFKDIIKRYTKLIVVGVSGGAYLAMQMILRRTELSRCIMISPHLLHYRFDEIIVNYMTNIDIIYRPNDKNLPTQLLNSFSECLKQHNSSTEMFAINALDDSYATKENEIWNIIMDSFNKND